MKMEALVFNGLAVFLVALAVVYGVWAQEPIGTTALALSGGLCVIIGGFFWFVSRRIDPRPEDRQDAEIVEGAGDLGFFSPGSYWPVTLAAAAALAGAGLAYYYVWLIVIGAAAVMFAIGGLLFEYYHSPPAHD
ncbi:MAG: cytochrome c oxidase subunit 4 [Geodermatophilaceae bacterium]|nr:cytochrome c oxidase subunit 4 [Geodermatophilaceae bacterium]